MAKNKFEYDLTIGMIVKNEAATLRKCLESIQPLREHLKLQLIITDTGSADGTIEIAQEFADLFLEFEWINDFSAARNVGVAQAKGRWFFYADADHEFDESIVEIANFINQPDVADKYGAANVNIRNYQGSRDDLRNYFDILRALIVNFSHGLRYFELPIHESIPLGVEELMYDIPVLVHHWGYLEDKFQEKVDRNNEIIDKSLEANPDDLNMHFQSAKTERDPVKKLERIESALALADRLGISGKDSGSQGEKILVLYLFKLRIHLDRNEWGSFEKTCEMACEMPQNTLFLLEYRAYNALAAAGQEKIDDSLKLYEQYLKLYQYLEKHPDAGSAQTGSFYFNQEVGFHKIQLEILKLATKEKKKQGAEQVWNKFSAYTYMDLKGHYSFFQASTELALDGERYQLLAEMYQFAQSKNLLNERDLLQKKLEEQWVSGENQNKKALAEAFSKKIVDGYSALWKLRLCAGVLADCPKEALDKLAETKDLYKNVLYADVFFASLQSGDPFCFLKESSFSALLEMGRASIEREESCADFVINTIPQPEFQVFSLKEAKFWAYISYYVVLWQCQQEFPVVEKVTGFLPKMTETMQIFMQHVYQPEMLQLEAMESFPQPEIFSFLVGEALKKMEQGDQGSYVDLLKFMVEIAPESGEIVSLLTAQVGGVVENMSAKSEMSALGLKVKSSIKALIGEGNFGEAAMLLEKYKSIAEGDPEISALEQAIGRK